MSVSAASNASSSLGMKKSLHPERRRRVSVVMSSPFGFAQGKLRRDIWILPKPAFRSRPDLSAWLHLGRDDRAFYIFYNSYYLILSFFLVFMYHIIRGVMHQRP